MLHPRQPLAEQPVQPVQFIADTPAAALDQIHRELGPEAVVLSVRRLPAHGVTRLWQRHGRVEVIAGIPGAPAPLQPAGPMSSAAGLNPASARPLPPAASTDSSGRWQTVAWIEAMGLLPAYAARLQARLDLLHPAAPPSLEAEWDIVRAALADFWSPPRQMENPRAPRTHVFVGPPGSGKTTVLCKWLTLAVLNEQRSARVWRLDSSIANTAEFLTVHCEMLGVPIERFHSASAPAPDLQFVDLPGVQADDPRAMAAVRTQLAELPSPVVHLVLNAAYETDVLLAQWHAFIGLEPTDVVLTHLDEETRRIKLWNLVFGTNCILGYLSAGQKIPGEFRQASPNLLFPSETSR